MRRHRSKTSRRIRITAITPATEHELRRRLMAIALGLYPRALTFQDLCEEALEPPIGFLASYALARAVRDLATAGLLRSDGLHVLPTDAALSFALLQVDV